MIDPLRSLFLTFYAFGIAGVVVRLLSDSGAPGSVERRPEGLRRYLPVAFIPVVWLLPPLLLFFRIGAIDAEWAVVRVVGFFLGIYAALLLLTAPTALGRFLVPRAVVFRDHELVTTGPYRLVRHPIYSGVLALWLGAALANLNAILALSWPIVLAGFSVQAGVEEELLRAKFGASYESYMRTAARFFPRLRR